MTGERRTRRPLAFVVELVWRQRRAVGVAVASGLGWQLAGIVVPVVLGWTVEHGIVQGERPAVWQGALALLVVGAVEAACAGVRHTAASLASMGAAADVREALTDASLALDDDARERLGAGEVVARATSDTDMVAELVEGMGHTVAEAVSVPVVLVVLLVIEPTLAAAVAVLVPVLMLTMWRYSVVWERRSMLAQQAMGDSIGAAQETVEGFRVLKGLGAEGPAVARFGRLSAVLRDRATSVGRLWMVFEPALEVLSVVSVAAVIWIGGGRVVDGSLGLGSLVAAVGLVVFLSGPIRTIGERILTVQSAFASARRIVEVLESVPPAIGEGPDPLGDGVPATLEARAIAVARGETVLARGLSLVVRPGELVILDGPTGSGKSTLLAVLAGLRAPREGRVSLGGIDLATWPSEAVRRRVHLVGAVPFLFAGSIAENLRLARPNAGEDELGRVLAATACGFVHEMPDGLESLLGERGVTLSGGQRQRLALARTALAVPSVLLLDGATSALDEHTERAVLAGLRTLLPETGLVLVTATSSIRAAAGRTVVVPGGARP